MEEKIEFKLEKSQIKTLKEWQNKIKDLFGEYGHYDFIFTPCGIGTVIKVKSHLTKTEINLSEEENW